MAVSADLLQRLASAAAATGAAGDGGLPGLVRRIATALRRTVVAADSVLGVWRVASTAPVDEDGLLANEAIAAVTAGEADPSGAASRSSHGWTVINAGLMTERPVALAMHGEWDLPDDAMALLADALRRTIRPPRSGLAARAQCAPHRLARRLGRTRGATAMCEVILDAMSRGVRAQTAAIAVMDPSERRLRIVATRGYPLLLVEHVRIEPGVGVIGEVYRVGKVMRVGGDADAPIGRKPRLRHRTNSFVGIPIATSDEVLAVACVTDREDDQPFSHADVSLLRALAAPAALALAQARATERAEMYAHAAAIDPVSGLFNRRYFHVRIDEELQRAKRHQTPLSLLMLDLDDFKAINDSFGHLAGDLVIKETAEIIRQSVRAFDVCARYGGEEFAIIMPGSAAEDAEKIAERIRGRVETYRPPERTMKGLKVTVSIGLAVSAPGTTATELIGQADQALYHAKHTGKNRVRSFHGAA
jgi:diguanylate cyclase (GGDEF)-like protein